MTQEGTVDGKRSASEDHAWGSRHPLLSVDGLRVSFPTEGGPVQALDGVDLELAPGETIGLAGESGSGKSVFGLSIARLVEGARSAGAIHFEGRDLMTATERELCHTRGSRIGFIFQNPLAALNPMHTVGDQVAEPLRLRGIGRHEARAVAIDMLDRVGIANPRERYQDYPHEFSGGMRQRVVIAGAIITEPSLLIADEPTTALDVRVQAQVLELIAELADERNTSVILVSHDLGVVAGYADRVAIMYAGKIIESGTTDDIYYNPQHPYTHGLIASVPRLDDDPTKPLHHIHGQAPPLTELPQGCRYHPRCPLAADICRTDEPSEHRLDNGHRSLCHFPGAMDIDS